MGLVPALYSSLHCLSDAIDTVTGGIDKAVSGATSATDPEALTQQALNAAGLSFITDTQKK